MKHLSKKFMDVLAAKNNENRKQGANHLWLA